MFYGKSSGADGHGSGRGGRHERFDQMVKQQKLIEQKKKEIQARLDAERQQTTLDFEDIGKSLGKDDSGTSATTSTTLPASQRSVEDEEDKKSTFLVAFNNDGSFLEQFKRMQEEALKTKQEEEQKAAAAGQKKVKEEPAEYDEYGAPIKPTRSIKFFHPDRLSSNKRAPDINTPPKANSRTFYDVPPPPPPPPVGPPPNRTGNQDIKPYYKANPYQNVPPPPPPPPVRTQSKTPSPKLFGFPSPQVKALAAVVAEQGDRVEDELRSRREEDPLMWFLHKPESTEYRTFRTLVNEIRADNKKRMYNQAPPPPPPPPPRPIIKQEPIVKIEPPTLPTSGTYSNFVKAAPSPSISNTPLNCSVKTEPCLESSSAYNNFVKSETIPSSTPFSNSIKVEPSSSSTIMVADTLIKSETPVISGIKREAPALDAEETETERKERKRRSRWGPQATEIPPIGVVTPPAIGIPGVIAIPGMMNYGSNLMNMPLMPVTPMLPGVIAKVNRTNPLLLAYAKQAYGRIDLDEDEWKQCKDAYKMNMVFQDIARKKAMDNELMMAGKFKHEYDSDEEITDEGTWEHKMRIKEMEKTKELADELTKNAKGKHHIGDFLPPDELAKFMEKYKAVKEGKQLDESEYQEYKIQQDNIGFKMLQKMGWSSGEGLGAEKQGIIVPVDKGNVPSDKQGLGVEKPGDLNEDDDEFTAYRKRMMLAYRFRPNPLNNPRRAYY